MKRFYATYVYAYGMEAKSEVFDDTESLLAFIKKAKADEVDDWTPYLGLCVIYGEKIEFEPATYVETWRIKEREDNDDE